MTHFEGKPLAGSYVVDDEGVRAKDVTLVDKGRLVDAADQPHAAEEFPAIERPRPVGRPCSRACSSSKARRRFLRPSSRQKYLALLKAQDKTFGYIVRGVRSDGQGGAAGPGIDAIVKVTLDGTETPVRGMRFGTVAADGVQGSR